MEERPKVGEILVNAGIIDDMQLSSALGEQTRWGRRLGVTLIKLGMVEEGHLIRALATQLDLPVASLKGKKIPDEVIAMVPARVASEHGVIPLFVKRQGNQAQLFLGMEDPSNLAVLDDLCFRTGMEVHPVMVGPTQISEAIDRYYHGVKPPKAQRNTQADADDGETIGELSLHSVDESPVTARPQVRRPPVAPLPVQKPRESTPRVEEVIDLEKRVPAAPLPSPSPPALPPALLEDVARALDETERTRIVVKALTQILVDQGIFSLDEIQDRIAQIKTEKADGASGA